MVSLLQSTVNQCGQCVFVCVHACVWKNTWSSKTGRLLWPVICWMKRGPVALAVLVAMTD